MLFCVRFTMMDKAHSCLILISFLGLVSAFQILNSFEDLQRATQQADSFGNRFPRHGWLLLHWFANNIDIDDNSNIITVNPDLFDPNRADFGAHCYHNYDNPQCSNQPLLPILSAGQGRYYTLGNLFGKCTDNNNNARAFPAYVLQYLKVLKYRRPENNMDRIIMWNRNGQIVQVYITQHIRNNKNYDPAKTYIITPNLLKDIRGRDINTISFLGTKQRLHDHIGRELAVDDGDDMWQIELKVIPTSKGKARICWSGIPSRILEQGVLVVLFTNDDSASYLTYEYVDSISGGVDTGFDLKGGLQVRLHLDYKGLFTAVGDEIERGAEFHDANGHLPVNIKDYGASLELFVEDGKACVRLYIKKTFTNWQSEFYYHWIVIVSSATEAEDDYKAYQWVVKLGKERRSDLEDIPDYDVYAYDFDVTMEPGDQARLRVRKYYSTYFLWTRVYSWVIDSTVMSTPSWNGVCELMTCSWTVLTICLVLSMISLFQG